MYVGEAEKAGSRVPVRSGCCHGAEHAKSVAVSWARGRLGWVALREVEMMGDAAFDIALGNRARSPKYAASAAPAIWNEWGGYGNRLLNPFAS